MACFHLKLNQIWAVTVFDMPNYHPLPHWIDITELCFFFFDEIMLPRQELQIAKSKLQPYDPQLMGLGQG